MASGTRGRTAATVPVGGLGSYRLEDQVGFLIRKASQRHTAIFARSMIEDLTPTQWAAMAKLAELGAASQNQLGRDTAMDVATIKGVVDRLVKRGFVTTKTDANDSRRSVIELSAAGHDLVGRCRAIAAAITAETLNALQPGEQRILAELLRRIS